MVKYIYDNMPTEACELNILNAKSAENSTDD
jgi:hypothetical protein